MKKIFTATLPYKLISLAIVGAAFFGIQAAQAAPAPAPTTNNTGQALEILQPVRNVTADPGQNVEVKISIRDVSSSKLFVRGEVNDFMAKGEDGTPKIILDDTNSAFSLKSWVAPLPEITLKPKQLQDFPVTIRVPKNASPGGYYAVVRFTATAPEISTNGVALSASLGALILLRVNGEAKQEMNVQEFSIQKDTVTTTFLESAPFNFVERLKNTGNIHEQPTGQVTLTDMFGNKTAVVNVNLRQDNVLPDSIRRFEQPLDSSVIGDRMLFGRYTADLKVTYGNGQTLTSQLSFWVIPWKLILFGVIALILIVIGLRIGIKRYNDYILRRAGSSRRR